jgi:hypothetical protein
VFENKALRRIFQYVACMGEGRVAYRGLVGKPEGKNHLEGPGVDGIIILKRIFRGMGLIWLRIGKRGCFVNAVMKRVVTQNAECLD